MKINFAAPITDLEGNGVVQDGKPLTLGGLVSVAMLSTYDDERHIGGAEKVKRFVIAQKAYDGGEADLTAEDVSLIKAIVGKCYGPLPVARAYELLDPPAKLKVVD